MRRKVIDKSFQRLELCPHVKRRLGSSGVISDLTIVYRYVVTLVIQVLNAAHRTQQYCSATSRALQWRKGTEDNVDWSAGIIISTAYLIGWLSCSAFPISDPLARLSSPAIQLVGLAFLTCMLVGCLPCSQLILVSWFVCIHFRLVSYFDCCHLGRIG